MTTADIAQVAHGLSIVALLIVGLSRYDAYSRRVRWVTFALFLSTMLACALTA